MKKTIAIDYGQMITLKTALSIACEHISDAQLLDNIANTLSDITTQFDKQ